MIAMMAMALQAAVPVAAAPTKVEAAPAQHAITSCPKAADDNGDIIVCGRADAQEQFRLRPLTHRYDPVGGPGLGFRVGAGQMNLHTEGSPNAAPRMMVTLKVPF